MKKLALLLAVLFCMSGFGTTECSLDRHRHRRSAILCPWAGILTGGAITCGYRDISAGGAITIAFGVMVITRCGKKINSEIFKKSRVGEIRGGFGVCFYSSSVDDAGSSIDGGGFYWFYLLDPR